MKNEVLVKTRKNRGDKTRLSKIRTPFTLCEFHFCTTFQKLHALGPLCEFHRNANLVRTLCEFVFCANFQNHALCLGESQVCENFAHHFPLCEIHFLFKSFVLHFKDLASSSILSKPLFRSPIAIHKAPFLHHPSSSTPPWQPLSIAPLHSRAIHYSPLPIFGNFISFHHQNPFKSSPNPLNPSIIQSKPCSYQAKA